MNPIYLISWYFHQALGYFFAVSAKKGITEILGLNDIADWTPFFLKVPLAGKIRFLSLPSVRGLLGAGH